MNIVSKLPLSFISATSNGPSLLLSLHPSLPLFWKCSPWFFSLKRAEANLILAGHPFPCTAVSDYKEGGNRRRREGMAGSKKP